MKPLGLILAIVAAVCSTVTAKAQDAELVGRVKIISPVPEPGTVDYEDCLTAIQLEVEKVVFGKVESATVVGVFWGMRFGKVSPAAELKVGDRVRAKFVQYALHARRLEKFKRLDQTKDFESPVLYALEWQKLDKDPDASEPPDEGPASDAVDDAATGQVADRPKVARMKAVLAAHGGDVIGGTQGVDHGPRFYDYEYLYTPRFWEVPAGVEADGPLDVIVDLHAQLASRGVQLVCAFVPCAAAVDPEGATRVPYLAAVDGRIDTEFQNFTSLLASKGVFIADCLPMLLAQPKYRFRNQEHAAFLKWTPLWSSWAAASCARQISTMIREDERTKSSVEWGKFFAGKKRSLDRVPPRLLREFGSNEFAVTSLLESVTVDDSEKHWIALGDETAEVWLIGGRFSSVHRRHRGDFGTHLAAALGTKVRVLAGKPEEPHASRENMCERGLPETAKVVIWEIPVPLIADPASWNRVALKP